MIRTKNTGTIVDDEIKEFIKVLLWGAEWCEVGDEDADLWYCLGGAETVGHILACWLVQRCGCDSVETTTGRDIVFCGGDPEFGEGFYRRKPAEILRRIKRYLKQELEDTVKKGKA